MIDRDFYTADGREWWEPREEDCWEAKTEGEETFERNRIWNQTGAISYKWESWGEWAKVESDDIIGTCHLCGATTTDIDSCSSCGQDISVF